MEEYKGRQGERREYGSRRERQIALIVFAAICIIAMAFIFLWPRFGSRSYVFAVVGDNQGGRNEVWNVVMDGGVNSDRPDFVLHCGDMVASGTRAQYDDFLLGAEKLRMPFTLCLEITMFAEKDESALLSSSTIRRTTRSNMKGTGS